ncbi:MAG: tetratricopeptide repeat protein [Bacteroidales bacterium]
MQNVASDPSLLEEDTISGEQRKDLLMLAIKKADAHPVKKENVVYQIRCVENLFSLGNYSLCVETLKSLIAKIEKIEKKDSAWEALHIHALVNLGQAETYLGAYEEAMGHFNEIRTLYGADINSNATAHSFNGIGLVFGARGQCKVALEYFQKSLKIFQRTKNSRGLYRVYTNIGGAFCGMGNYQEALNAFVEAQRIVLSQKYKGTELVYVHLNFAIAYEGLGKTELAEKYYIEAAKIAENKKAYHLRMFVNNNYANTLYTQGKYVKAQEINSALIQEAKKLGALKMQMIALRMESSILEKQGKFKEANAILHESYKIFDTIYNQESENRIASIRYQFDHYKVLQEEKIQKKKLELAEAKVLNKNLWIAFLSLLAIFAGIAIALMIRRILRQCRINNLMKTKVTEYKQHENTKIEGIKTSFAQEMDAKNKELTSNALLFLKFNELSLAMNQIVKKMKVRFSLKKEEKELVEEMESLLRSFSSSQDLAEFKTYFEQVNSSFFKKLEAAYPNLTPNEMRLCAFISLGLSAKEIASVTNRTFQSIWTAKFRLKKKMQVDPDSNLYDIFLKL